MREALRDITATARALAHNKRTVLLFFGTYIALLATLMLFILTREATIRDLFVTLATLIAVPALFFLLQAMCVSFSETAGVLEVIKESVSILRRLIIVSIPFVVIGLAFYLILDMVDARFAPAQQGRRLMALAREGETWPQVVFSTIRLVMFGVVLPLTCIHVWIAARRQNVRQILRDIKPIIARAFALPSVKTYVIGFGLFGILPYILIAVKTPSDRAWLEISLLGLRQVLAFALMLVGWVITVGALQRGAATIRLSDE